MTLHSLADIFSSIEPEHQHYHPGERPRWLSEEDKVVGYAYENADSTRRSVRKKARPQPRRLSANRRVDPTSFFVDCRLYREPLNSINWKERLKAHFYPPPEEVEREEHDKGSGWRHAWRFLFKRSPLNKDPDLMVSERWNDDPVTQCAHLRDLFQRRELRFNDELATVKTLRIGSPMPFMGKSIPYFNKIRMDGMRGYVWVFDSNSNVWFKCTSHVYPTMKYPQFLENDQQLVCSVWQPTHRTDGKCGLLNRHCDYKSLTMRTTCVEKAKSFPETSAPVPPYWDREQCIYIGDHGERIPRDFQGMPADYEGYIL
ncbi:unnamed protein product [Amoebophrya sp. A25]|nr:unnamed protein product [Amoebophrya sp. A25]|eukprot:GSA25T00004005001.1